MKHIIVLFGLLFLAFSAQAVVPESGIWWNSSQSGRGYGIEIQDNTIFVTYYAYDSNGDRSAFYTSTGTFNLQSGTASTDFVGFSDGQCFGCPYRRPHPQLLGRATFHFTSRMTGTITLPSSETISIKRELFAGPAPRDELYGIWHLTTGANGVYFGDILWFQAPDDDLPGGFSGRVLDGGSGRILVGGVLDDGSIAVLVDSSPSYYTFYQFEWSYRTIVGKSWTYLKEDEPTGDGLTFFGSRLLGREQSEQLSGTSSIPPAMALHSESPPDSAVGAIDVDGDGDRQAALRASLPTGGSMQVRELAGDRLFGPGQATRVATDLRSRIVHHQQ